MTYRLALFMLFLFPFTCGQQSVCYHIIATVQTYRTYIQGSSMLSYSCGLFDWSRCYRVTYSSHFVDRSHTLYHSERTCCEGYSMNGDQCSPICNDCPDSHLCLAPNACVCPEWSPTDDCSEPPQNITLTATGSDELEISWVPLLHGATLYFVIFEGETHYVDPTSSLHMTFESLTPYTSYNCCVAANTTSGPTRLGCATRTTLQSVPEDAPQELLVATLNSTAISVQWEPPLTPNGIIIFYTVYINDCPVLNVSNHSCLLDGFSPYEVVNVSVSASTKIGEGPQSEQRSETTHETVPGPVEKLEVTALSDEVLHVSWDPPVTPNGVLTGYHVVVTNLIDSTKIIYEIPPRVHEWNISVGIGPYIRYEVTVRASTSVGIGDSVHRFIYSREGAPHSPPPSTTTTRSSATTGSVEWDEMSWEDLRGWLVSYEIGYQSVRSGQCPPSDSITNDTVSVDQEMFEVTGLDPGLQYCVWVAGRTSPGVGPFSYTLIPWYTSSEFMVALEKANCTEWIAKDQVKILKDLARDISRGIELFCSCSFPSEYVGDGKLACEKQTLIYSGRIVSTSDRNSTDLLKDLIKWASGAPTVIANGEELKIVGNKSQPTKEPPKAPTNGEEEPSKEPPRVVPIVTDTPQESSNPALLVGPAVGGVALLAIVLLVAVIIGAILYHRQKKKSSIVFSSTSTDRQAGCTLTSTSPLAKLYEEPIGAKCVREKEPLPELPNMHENLYESLKETDDPALDETGLHNSLYEDITGTDGGEESEDLM